MDLDDSSDPPDTKLYPNDFTEFFPYACQKFDIFVNVVKIQEGVDSVQLEKKKTIGKLRSKAALPVSLPLQIKSGSTVQEEYAVRIVAKYLGHALTHLTFQKCKQTIPWEVFRILIEAVDFYPDLNSITVNSGLDAYCLHEITKLSTVTNITNICLDGTCILLANYSTLLNHAKNLQMLSLARCKLGDNAMREIIENMESPKPAHNTLCALNVSSNALTDKSAKNFAQMLRRNRKLSYLNLNGNRISTDGAILILKVLTKFPLTNEEASSYREGFLKYLRDKQELFDKISKDFIGKKETTLKKKSPKSDHPPDMVEKEKMDKMAAEHTESGTGEYENPFHVPVEDEGKLYCIGNNVITYLGLAYNNISYPFLKILLDVLQYQRSCFFTKKQRGLACIKIEGNPLPTMCQELKDIDMILTLGLLNLSRQRKSIVGRVKK